MIFYQLIPVGQLFATRASLHGDGGSKVLTLLVDTGSTYTILPVESLESIGSSPAASKDHVRIITGSGIVLAPRVTVPLFHCLGRKMERYQVIGHTLPPAGPIDGLLGMDFLQPLNAKIDLGKGVIEIS